MKNISRSKILNGSLDVRVAGVLIYFESSLKVGLFAGILGVYHQFTTPRVLMYDGDYIELTQSFAGDDVMLVVKYTNTYVGRARACTIIMIFVFLKFLIL